MRIKIVAQVESQTEIDNALKEVNIVEFELEQEEDNGTCFSRIYNIEPAKYR